MTIPPKLLAIRRAQLLLAVSNGLNGGIKGFLASGLISADPDDPSNIAFYHEPFALPGGRLATLLATYLTLPPSGDANGNTGLGMTSGQAATQMATLFASAATLSTGT